AYTERGDAAAGAEGRAPGTANDGDADRVVGLERLEDPRKLVPHRDGQRVHLRLAVDPERRDGARSFDPEELAHGGPSVYRPSRSSRRRILPDAVFGISRTKTKRRGRFQRARSPLARQCASSSWALTSGAAGTTNAPTRSPHFASGSPITATARTPRWPASTSSTSTGRMFSPPPMSVSSTPPGTQRPLRPSTQPLA